MKIVLMHFARKAAGTTVLPRIFDVSLRVMGQFEFLALESESLRLWFVVGRVPPALGSSGSTPKSQ
jgi:hypothetical protein